MVAKSSLQVRQYLRRSLRRSSHFASRTLKQKPMASSCATLSSVSWDLPPSCLRFI